MSPTTTVDVELSGADTATVTLNGPDHAVAGLSTFDADTRVVVFLPDEPLLWSTTYTVSLSVPGAAIDGESWTFTTATEPVVYDVSTIFGDATPDNPAFDDPSGVQVGTRFTVAVPGTASSVRFYKGQANTGAHTGYLWDPSGAVIATVDFIDETPTGWQTASFLEPAVLVPGVEYRVGLYGTTGRYAVSPGGFAEETVVGPFTVPADGGVYTYSQGFPGGTSPHGYWVDVVFHPSG